MSEDSLTARDENRMLLNDTDAIPGEQMDLARRINLAAKGHE